MEGYKLESAPFYTSLDGSILLFGGVSDKRQGLPLASYVLDGRDLDPNHRSVYTEMDLQTFLAPH